MFGIQRLLPAHSGNEGTLGVGEGRGIYISAVPDVPVELVTVTICSPGQNVTIIKDSNIPPSCMITTMTQTFPLPGGGRDGLSLLCDRQGVDEVMTDIRILG